LPEDLLGYLDERIRQLEREIEVLRRLRGILEERASRPPAEPRELPTLLESVKWRRYPSGAGEWCFEDEAPPELIELLERGGGRCELDGYLYVLKRLSGGKMVVARRPA